MDLYSASMGIIMELLYGPKPRVVQRLTPQSYNSIVLLHEC